MLMSLQKMISFGSARDEVDFNSNLVLYSNHDTVENILPSGGSSCFGPGATEAVRDYYFCLFLQSGLSLGIFFNRRSFESSSTESGLSSFGLSC